MRTAELGVALLEVLVAFVILTTAALTLVQLVDSGTRAVLVARVREREVADEERLLAAFTLLDRADFDRRIGRHMVGPYVVNVQGPERVLYRIALSRRSSSQIEDLVTVVYRPDAAHAP